MATEIDRLAKWALSPALALGAAVAAMLMVAPVAGHPMWRTRTLNMTEAAAARDVATIALLLERGEDPNMRRPIRAPLLDGVAGELTPVEAGVAAGRLEVVALLMARGAVLDPRQRVSLACQARKSGHHDVAAFLAGAADRSCPS